MATRRRREIESKMEGSENASEEEIKSVDEPQSEPKRSTRLSSPKKEDKKSPEKTEKKSPPRPKASPTKKTGDVKEEEKDVNSSMEGKTENDSDPETSQGDEDDSDRDSSFGGLSLDVLAQVATDRLELEPKKKLTKRSIQHMDLLNLEQIKQLSERVLVNMFADMSANEMKRNYTYICSLIPNECKQEYSSFGNENRARSQMVSHLKDHVKKLMDKEKGKEGQPVFVAEPVPARKKRILAEKAAEKRKRQKEMQMAARRAKRGIMTSGDFTSMKNRSRTLSGSKTYDMANKDLGMMSPPPPKKTKIAAQLKRNISRKFTAKAAAAGIRGPDDDDIGTSDIDVETSSIKEEEDKSGKSMEQTIQENEQFILDLLSRSQPYHDHCYTTIFGKRKWEVVTLSNADNVEEEDDERRPSARTGGLKSAAYTPYNIMDRAELAGKTVLLRVNSAKGVEDPSKLHIPILRVAQLALGMGVDGESVSAEEIIDLEKKHSAQRPYPPMPKSDLARRGRVPVPEEEISSSDDDGNNQSATPIAASQPSAPPVVRPSRQIRVTAKSSEGSLEWEKKMALRCIRELRCKKKDEAALVCKICKNKTFTATATLMYHYRSHAGIKPFVCLICNTTFTRQHSLNYHMLIHNNQSRFTCKDCGRKFRHPSHFKEHLRRHTGETPFHCTDCPLRFKTRNTYKRHLKTRHGKLLTAHGIKVMPHEEFLKVRTKQYKRGSTDGEGEDFEEEEEESEEEEDSVKSEQDEEEQHMETTETGGTTIPAPIEIIPIEGPSGDRASGPSGDRASDLLDDAHSASNKLLQFCSQVVNNEAL